MSDKPLIAITMGDPAGVGPEIIIKALAKRKVRRICTPLVIGDKGLLGHIAGKLKLKPLKAGEVRSISSLDINKLGPGRPNRRSSKAMIAYIEEAVKMTLNKEAAAMVTGPISKEAARMAGFKFPGHTEFIAHLTKTKDFAMMLGGRDLKVILVTIHEALRDVPKLVTRASVFKTIKITHEAFRHVYKNPRIAVAGLNPHAGEGGMFGDEDIKIVAPAIKKARKAGINAVGPLPPDTVFFRAVKKKEFDLVVCMYHDQGLGPLKLLHFEDGINATLGLPIVRTSVDHGTAYDIAWKGMASPDSLISAIEAAVEMSGARKK